MVPGTNVKLRDLCARRGDGFFLGERHSLAQLAYLWLNCTDAFCGTRAETFSLVLKRCIRTARLLTELPEFPRVKCLFIQSRNLEVFLGTSILFIAASLLLLLSRGRGTLSSVPDVHLVRRLVLQRARSMKLLTSFMQPFVCH